MHDGEVEIDASAGRAARGGAVPRAARPADPCRPVDRHGQRHLPARRGSVRAAAADAALGARPRAGVGMAAAARSAAVAADPRAGRRGPARPARIRSPGRSTAGSRGAVCGRARPRRARTPREALARFVHELRAIDPAGAPPAGRRPLAELDDVTREAIAAARGVIDADAALRPGSARSQAPAWDGDAGLDPHRPAAAQPAGRRRADAAR